jgi:hypothetical protein
MMPDTDDRHENAEKTSEKSSGVLGVLTSNATLMAWLVLLGFGGALLTFYYNQIHYFPELKWEESFTYLIAISLLGGFVAAIYSFLLYFPGVIWSELLIFDTELLKELCYPTRVGEEKFEEPCLLSLWRHVAAPFSFYMIALHFAMLENVILVGTTAISGLVVLTLFYHSEFSDILKEVKERRASRLLKAVAAADVAALLSFVSLFVLYKIVDPEGYSWPLLLLCTLVVVVSNVLVAIQFRNKPGRAALTGIVAALVLLFCGEVVSEGRAALSTRIMERFGLGKGSVRMVVTATGIEVLQGQEVRFKPSGQNGVICNAKLLSRLGSEYYVEVQGHRVTLAKDLVRSWSAEIPKRTVTLQIPPKWIRERLPEWRWLRWSLEGLGISTHPCSPSSLELDEMTGCPKDARKPPASAPKP